MIKLSLATSLVAALGLYVKPRLLRRVDEFSPIQSEEVKIVKVSCLPNCTESCWLQAYVYNDRVRVLMPAPDYLEPEYTRGCLRGLSQVFLWYGPDRLRRPMVREPFLRWCRGEVSWEKAVEEAAKLRGSPDKFIEVDWDIALDCASKALAKIMRDYGPASIAYTIQVPGTAYMGKGALMRLASLFGWSSMHAYPLNGDLPTFWAPTFGVQTEELETHEYLNSKLILIFGSNFTVTRTMSARMLVLAREKGAKIVVIDMNYPSVANIADELILINPATDAALALGIVYVLIRDKLYDAEFTKTYTDMPLLIRLDTKTRLKASEVKELSEYAKNIKIPAYRELYTAWDTRRNKIVIVDPRTLERKDPVTGEIYDPALEGEFEVELVDGKRVKVKPVFQLLKDLVYREYTPDKVARIISPSLDLVPKYIDVIERLAREIATIKPVAIIYGASNWQWYNGDLKGRALSLLVALTGNIGMPGSGISTYAGQYKIKWPMWSWWGYDKELTKIRGVAATRRPRWLNWSIFLNYEYRQSEEWRKYRSTEVPWPEKGVRALLIQWWNPFDQHNKALILTGKARREHPEPLDFIMTTEIQWTTSVEYSDIVLPAASWFEKYDLASGPLNPYVQITQPAHDPLFESMPEIWIFKEIAVRTSRIISAEWTEEEIEKIIGLKKSEMIELAKMFYPDPELQRQEEEARMAGRWSLRIARDIANKASELAIERLLEDGRSVVWAEGVTANLTEGITLEELKKRPIRMKLPTPGNRQIPFWVQINMKVPFPNASYPHPIPATARYVKSGRIEFYKDEKAFLDLGEELPVHKDPFEECLYKLYPEDRGKYELVYLTGNSLYRIHSTHSNNAMMLALQDYKPKIYMNPKTMAKLGLKTGDYIELYNRFGNIRGYLVEDPGIHPRVVVFYQGWWRRYTDGTHYNAPNYPWIKPTEIIYFTPGVWEPNTKWNNTLVAVRKLE
ncbi:MAG: molybdopterin-dependent oxidoreductase [Acidilobaceae archaeon]